MVTNFKSAFESVPGRDALLQYEAKNYPIRTYVERNGLIFKSITATSENFVLSQWELISDLREVRVPNIAARNSLTGTTGTSYGIHTPILDNTTVLVLNASADPHVGSAQFARYNYNQGNSSWLLLQVGTGATSATTSISYSNVLNRPFVVSGVTVNAGAGLSGGGSVFGSIPAAGGIINLAHADTSSQTNLTPTGRTYIQQLKFDTYGHVTGATQSTWTHPDTSSQSNVLNTGRTYIQSISVDGDGHIVSLSSSPWTHPDTSIQADSINSGNTFIQSIYLDGDGHVIGLGVGVAAGGGGGGSALKYNGDSGGVLTMNSGATLTISGGSNISTQRTGNASNPGLKINLNPAGSVGQVQYNGVTGLAASSNFVFDTTNQALTLGTRTGATGQYSMTFGTNNSANARSIAVGVGNKIQSVNGSNGAFGASNKIIGSGGGNSFAFGQLNVISGTTSGNMAFGNSNNVQGGYSMAIGSLNVVNAGNAIAIGTNNKSTGTTSYTQGDQNIASGVNARATGILSQAKGYSSVAQNVVTLAGGYASFAGGLGLTTGPRPVIASGQTSFNFSENSISQSIGFGANANNSVILGGKDHNIAAGNVRSAIIGGFGINLTGSTYIDNVVVPNLAIFTTPSAGGSDDILTWNSTTKKIGKVTQASVLVINSVVNVSSAQMLNSFTSPIVIIPAPGAGKIINVLSISGSLIFGTVAYATNISAFFRYNGLSSPINSASWNIAQTSNKFFRFAIGSNGTGEDPSLIDNKSVTLSTQTGNPTAGDGTFKVYVSYQIVTL